MAHIKESDSMESLWIIVLAGLWIGLSKGGVGGPMAGAVLLPLLSRTMSVSKAAGLLLPLFLIGDLFAIRAYWRQWDMKHLRLLLPAAVIGVIMGIYLLATLPDEWLKRVLGVFTLVVVAYKLGSDRLKQLDYTHQGWHGYLAGLASGFASALANVGGPPITAYLLLQKLSPIAFVGTVTLFFFIVNVMKIPGYISAGIIDAQELIQIAWIVPFIPLGVWMGRRIIGWINTRWFEYAMIAVLVWAGLSLLVGAA